MAGKTFIRYALLAGDVEPAYLSVLCLSLQPRRPHMGQKRN